MRKAYTWVLLDTREQVAVDRRFDFLRRTLRVCVLSLRPEPGTEKCLECTVEGPKLRLKSLPRKSSFTLCTLFLKMGGLQPMASSSRLEAMSIHNGSVQYLRTSR